MPEKPLPSIARMSVLNLVIISACLYLPVVQAVAVFASDIVRQGSPSIFHTKKPPLFICLSPQQNRWNSSCVTAVILAQQLAWLTGIESADALDILVYKRRKRHCGQSRTAHALYLPIGDRPR